MALSIVGAFSESSSLCCRRLSPDAEENAASVKRNAPRSACVGSGNSMISYGKVFLQQGGCYLWGSHSSQGPSTALRVPHSHALLGGLSLHLFSLLSFALSLFCFIFLFLLLTVSMSKRVRVSVRLGLPFRFLPPDWQSAGAHVTVAIIQSVFAGRGGGRRVSSPGRERNGLDLNCSLVLILATTERWTSPRYQIAPLSLLLPAPG